MRNFKIIVIVLLLLIPVAGLRSVSADSPFLKYKSDIKWREEQLHLDNFAHFLVKNPEYIGYIYVFTKGDEPTKKSESRTKRAVRYLTKDLPQNLRIEESRIKIIYSKRYDGAYIILQPTAKGSPPIDFN